MKKLKRLAIMLPNSAKLTTKHMPKVKGGADKRGNTGESTGSGG